MAVSCGVGCKCSSHPKLPWLWYRLAAAALIRPLVWELPQAASVALKSQKQTNKQTKKKTQSSSQEGCQSFETKAQAGEGRSGNMPGGSNPRPALTHERLSSLLGTHSDDIFCIFSGDGNCHPISRCMCVPFSFLLWRSSDNHQPALVK